MWNVWRIQKDKKNLWDCLQDQTKTADFFCKTNQNTEELFAKSHKNLRNHMKTHKESIGIVGSDWKSLKEWKE